MHEGMNISECMNAKCRCIFCHFVSPRAQCLRAVFSPSLSLRVYPLLSFYFLSYPFLSFHVILFPPGRNVFVQCFLFYPFIFFYFPFSTVLSCSFLLFPVSSSSIILFRVVPFPCLFCLSFGFFQGAVFSCSVVFIPYSPCLCLRGIGNRKFKFAATGRAAMLQLDSRTH